MANYNKMNHVTVAPYPGAKHRIALQLASMMVFQGTERYYDLFGGAGNLLIQKPLHKKEIYNDLDKDMCYIFKALSKKETREELIEIMLTLPYSDEFYVQSKAAVDPERKYSGMSELDYTSGMSELDYASRVWFLLITSMNGDKNNRLKKINKALNETTFRNMILKKILALERFEGVEVTNRDALDIMQEEALDKALSSKTMYFLDSPYFSNRAGYQYDMATKEEHIRYCHLVGKLGGYRMVCGYDNNTFYDEILVREYGFHKYLVKEVAKNMQISAKGTMKDRVEEYVWLSYEIGKPFQL